MSVYPKGKKEYVIRLNLAQNSNIDNTVVEIKTVWEG